MERTFYVLQRSLKVAAQTCDGGIACAAVRHAEEILLRLLLDHLQTSLAKLDGVSAKLAGAAGAAIASAHSAAIASAHKMGGDGGAGAALAEKASLAVSAAGASQRHASLRTLSALQLCVAYMPKLWQSCEDDLTRALPPSALRTARAQLEKAGSTRAAFEAALHVGLTKLREQLMPRLLPRLDGFEKVSWLGSRWAAG